MAPVVHVVAQSTMTRAMAEREPPFGRENGPRAASEGDVVIDLGKKSVG
jgi:hypothetical protein